MTPLTDELLRRRLADRAVSSLDVSLAAIATSVTGRRQRRAPGPAGRWSVVGSVAVAVVIGVVLVGALLSRTAPPTSVLGSASLSPELSSDAAAASIEPTTPSFTPSASSVPVAGCDTLGFDAQRCAALVARARRQAGNPQDVLSIAVRKPDRDGVSLGSAALADVDFVTAGHGVIDVQIRCLFVFGAVSSDRVCSADPQIRIDGGVSHDTPCGPTPGDDNHPCATLPPSPKPAVVAASTPLILRVFDVPLDHVGHYDVFVGNAWLPDGLLGERSGSLGDPRPTAYWIDQGIEIQVRPVPPCPGGCPATIESIYHVPFHGPQPVRVYLVFDVVDLTVPGTVLEIRNLVVR